MELEQRTCARDGCAREFKVMGNSIQKYCSRDCAPLGEMGVALRKKKVRVRGDVKEVVSQTKGRLLTSKEVSDALGIGISTVPYYRNRGVFKEAGMRGKGYLFDLTQCSDALAEYRKTNPQAAPKEEPLQQKKKITKVPESIYSKVVVSEFPWKIVACAAGGLTALAYFLSR